MANNAISLEKWGAKLFPHRGTIWGALGLVLFLFAHPHNPLFSWGIALMGLGEGLRVWGTGYIKNYRGPMQEAEKLTTAGPYAYLRNPLYLANGIIGTGIALLSGLWWSIILFWFAFYLLYFPIIRAEESFLENKFGETYTAYARKVPRFLPHLLPYPERRGTFSWSVIEKKEIITLFTLGTIISLFYLRGFGFLKMLDRLFLWF
ncbi:MAG TPA: isoprenylcysteine carboxylmethyltransferase family protein [Candidatus Atribacteria bacterium]|nr:isoprenylcysteine carboxylmethyltransferase family protein [Candidatus Atribacteria bacterium]